MLPSRESLPHGHNGGPDGAAMARDPKPHGGRPPKDARHQASSRRGWPTWLRGLGVGLCRPIAWEPHEAAPEEIKMGAAKHLALQHFEAIDMPLDRASRPGQSAPSFDRLVVLIQPFHKTLQGFQWAGRRTLQPGTTLGRLPLAGQRGEIFGEVDGLGHLCLLGPQLGQLVCLSLRALLLPSEDEPRRPAWRKGRRRGLCHDGERLAPALASGGQALRLANAADIGRDAAITPRIPPWLELAKQRYGGVAAGMPACEEIIGIGIEQTPLLVAAVLPYGRRRHAEIPLDGAPAPHLSAELKVEVLSEALNATRSIERSDARAEALGRLARQCLGNLLQQGFEVLLDVLPRCPRHVSLRAVSSFFPFLEEYQGPKGLEEVRRMIVDIAHWFP